MTEQVGSGPDARHLEVLATAAHRDALRAAGLRTWWGHPGTWARVVGSALLLLLGLRLYGAAWPVVLLVAFAVPAVLLGVARLRFEHGMRRRLDESWGDGTVHGTAFDEHGFTSRGPLGAVEYRLPAIREVRRRADVVEVRLRPRGIALVHADLFPLEEEQRLAEALARS